MRMTKTLLLGMALFASPSLAAQIPVSPSVKWATFSFQRALTESAQGKAALQTFSTLQEQKAKEVEDRATALKAREDAFQQSLAVLSPEARTEQAKDLDRFRLDTERFIEDARREVLGVQRDFETSFLTTLRPILEQLIKDQNLSVVISVEGDGLVWADDAIDITPSVISQLAKLVSDQR